MMRILKNRTYARLFAAQVVALLGTGLLTVALGLTAYQIAGERAGQVLGIALTIKMIAYVGLSPLATAIVARLDRRRVLIGADLIRAAAALALPFIDAAWQIYVLIFVLQAASATFTPTFQAAIPDVLPDEADYTRALSLSRLVYDIENVVSPVMAGLLLMVISSSNLFIGTTIGFLVSAALVRSVRLPGTGNRAERPFIDRLTRGTRIYLATPRLRGLLALNLTVASIGAVVIVLSVVIVKTAYGGSDTDLAVALGAYGAGSMTVALILPRLLDHVPDRPVMLWAGSLAAALMTALGLLVLLAGWPGWPLYLSLWALLGASLAAIMTPSGRLLRRSAAPEDRPAIFAAQFALSHACWLFAYPLAGFLGSHGGFGPAMVVLGLVAAGGVAMARLWWPHAAPDALEHSHADLPPDHPHLRDAKIKDGVPVHRHRFVIDDEHRVWPTSG